MVASADALLGCEDEGAYYAAGIELFVSGLAAHVPASSAR